MSNGLLLSWSFKMSDVSSYKFSALHHANPQYALVRNAHEGGSDPTKYRDAPCVKGWGRSRLTSFQPSRSPTVLGTSIALTCRALPAAFE